MSNQEILEKAIQKAIDGGLKLEVEIRDNLKIELYEDHETLVDTISYQELIFNHDFAKDLWPDDGHRPETPDGVVMDWQYHLQQMVIADDPIRYLGDHV